MFRANKLFYPARHRVRLDAKTIIHPVNKPGESRSVLPDIYEASTCTLYLCQSRGITRQLCSNFSRNIIDRSPFEKDGSSTEPFED